MRLVRVLDDRRLLLALGTRLVARQPSLVLAVVDAPVGQGDHAAGNPDVEHRRCGIRQELSGRGAELIHAAHKPAPAAEGLANGAQVRRRDGREVGVHLVRVELVVL